VGTSLLLFYNILLNPAHVRALQDLELIGRATLTLSRFPSRCVYGDSAEKKLLNNHFSELHILAKKAISSTQSGRFLATGGR
jgi:hypothetical protein